MSITSSTELYTTSRLRVLRTCPRQHHYRYRLGIRGPETEAMRFGTSTHAALEAWLLAWKSGDLDGRLDAAIATVETSTLSEYDRARLRSLLVGYDDKWGRANWEILDVEVEFRYEFGGYAIGGKIDAIIRDLDDGRVFVLEHKTTSRDASPGSEYWTKLVIDCQLSIYVDGASTLGYDIAGCIYDVLAKPQHDLREATPVESRKFTIGKGCKFCGGKADVQGSGLSAATQNGQCVLCKGTGWKDAPRLHANQRAEDETLEAFTERVVDAVTTEPDSFLMREIIVRPEAELVRMRSDLIDWIKLDQVGRIVFGDQPPRNDGACFAYHQRCPYFAACTGDADIDNQLVFPRGAVHSELSSAA